MNNISMFCEQRGLPKRIEQAFIVYCKDLYASRFEINPTGDTITRLVGNLSTSELQDTWNNFIQDLKSVTPTELVSPS